MDFSIYVSCIVAAHALVRVRISRRNERMGHITYRIISFFDASLKPDCPTSHEIAQHDVHEQAIADDCNLTRMGDFWWILVEKVLDYLSVTAWFLQH
jgi:hypothetical protein